jgi:hypothetical protein
LGASVRWLIEVGRGVGGWIVGGVRLYSRLRIGEGEGGVCFMAGHWMLVGGTYFCAHDSDMCGAS